MAHTNSYQKFALTGTLLSCLALTGLPAANAAIYKWTDSDGNMHYSNERPKDKQVKITTVKVRATQAKRREQADSETDKKTQTLETADDNDQQLDSINQDGTLSENQQNNNREESSKQANIDGAKQRRCEQARIELAILAKDIPVYLDETEQYRLNWAGDTYTGKRDYLADEARATAQEKTKETIAAYCANPNDEEAQTLARKKWARSEYCLLNQVILKEFQDSAIKASQRQLNKQQALTDKYCNANAVTPSSDEPEPKIFRRPRVN